MKTVSFRRAAASVIAVLMLIAAVLCFTSCGDENVNSGTGGSSSTGAIPKNEVVINVSDNVPEETTLVKTLERIRETVVDVDSYSASSASAGSGVIIGYDQANNVYYIVTNHHVIDGGTSFTVDVLNIAEDGSESTTVYSAQLIGSAPSRDIAVLAIEVSEGVRLEVAEFIEDSDNVKVGTEVVAIGNPLGILDGTVTRGIISATKREGLLSVNTLMCWTSVSLLG